MFNLFSTKKEQSKLDTAKAIMRGCPPYMFKSNWEESPKQSPVSPRLAGLVAGVLAIASAALGMF